MKHALIIGHPDPDSFTMAMAQTYANVVSHRGHTCVVRDLYRLKFDPMLKLSEMPDRPDWSPAPDVEEERRLLADVDVFAFFYPLWFNSPPAVIKGYIERVFGVGFGYSELSKGGQEPLLVGRQMVHISASGSSSAWLNEQGAWASLRRLFDDYFGRVCGLRVRQRIHFDSVVPGLASRWIDENLGTLKTKVSEYFCTDTVD